MSSQESRPHPGPTHAEGKGLFLLCFETALKQSQEQSRGLARMVHGVHLVAIPIAGSETRSSRPPVGAGAGVSGTDATSSPGVAGIEGATTMGALLGSLWDDARSISDPT